MNSKTKQIAGKTPLFIDLYELQEHAISELEYRNYLEQEREKAGGIPASTKEEITETKKSIQAHARIVNNYIEYLENQNERLKETIKQTWLSKIIAKIRRERE